MNILIAEDDPTSRKLLHAQLAAAGHDVLTAADGIEAVALLRSKRMDAVISDIRMPRMDDFDLCREVRKDAQLRRLPFIFYSYTFTSFAHQCFALGLGADSFFKKPAPTPAILEALEQLRATCGSSLNPPVCRHQQPPNNTL